MKLVVEYYYILGETVKEQIAIKGWSFQKFNAEMNFSELEANCFFKGNVVVDDDVAKKIYETLGISTSFWKNLELGSRSFIEEQRKFYKEKGYVK